MAPIVYSLVNTEFQLVLVTNNSQVYKSAKRAWWLRDSHNVKLVGAISTAELGNVREKLLRLQWIGWRTASFFSRHNVRLVVFEWREGQSVLPRTALRRFMVKLFSDLPTRFKEFADVSLIPTVAVPHGHTALTSLVRTRHVVEVLERNDGKLPFADRDSFTRYVFASAYHREKMVQSSTMSGENVRVWGSARYNRKWVELLYTNTATSSLIGHNSHGKRRILFFLPKWFNLVDRAGTIDLLNEITKLSSIEMTIRAHARSGDSGLSDNEMSHLLGNGTVTFASTSIPSPSLIKECDVLVDVDSSIAFDAVLLNKPYVRPRYLQDASVRTIWDELGGAHQTDSCEATVALLTQTTLQPAPRDATFDDVVFGGSGEIVLNRYRDELRALANR